MKTPTAGAELSQVGITVTGLRFERTDFCLDVPSWQAPRGSLIGLIGVNGAGKTTFMQLLAGQLAPRAGRIAIDGVDSREFGWRIPDLVGLVPDSMTGLPDLTLADHLELAGEIYEFWDHGYATSLLARLEVPPHKKLKAMSRGTRVKAGFVMVEASRPPFLILDEPTSGLDPMVRLELLTVLKEAHHANPSRVILFSTHILEDIAEVATSISLVRRGVVHSPRQEALAADWRTCVPSSRPEAIAKVFDCDTFF